MDDRQSASKTLIRDIETLRGMEKKWRQWFEDAPISLWEQDYSEVKRRVDEIRDLGVENVETYFQSHPDLCRELAALVRVVDINKFTLRLYGARTKEELLSGITRIFSRESYEDFVVNLMTVAEGKTRFSAERSHVALSGEPLYVQLHWAVAPGHEDTYGRVLVSIVDITDRKRNEEALRESEKKYRIILESMEEGFHEVDLSGSLTFFNESFRKILGYSHEELMGMNYRYYAADAAHKNRVAEAYKRVFATGDPLQGFVWDIVRKDGKRRTVEVSASLIRDKNNAPVGFRGLVRDITDRRQAEEALESERRQLLSIFDSIEEPIYVSDPETYEILFVNRALRKKFQEEPVGQICYRVFQGLESPCPFCTNEIILKQSPAPYYWEHENPVLGRTFALNDRIIRWPDGRDVRVELAVDITERKKAEKEKEKLQGQLAQAQKMESVGRLAGGVAHDFNNMLSVILGHAEMALMQVEPTDPLHRRLRQIQQTAMRSADLVRQLLAFARKQTVTPKVLDLNDTVAGMLKILRRLIGEDIDLVWIPGANLWPIRMDPAQIDQILANLCVNARDAIADVGKVTIETENVAFSHEDCADRPGFPPGDYVLMVVSDDGCGMDREVLNNLFEPFFTTKEAGKGTGLGLATVYGIIKQNEGFINVYSEPGRGTTFRVYLPRYGGEVPRDQEDGPLQALHKGDETVLLVEDDPTLLDIGLSMLERLGYRVLSADGPDKAIHLAAAHTGEIQLLITDVIMPAMNGKDLARRLAEVRPAIKILFMSGYTANVIAHHGVLDEGVHFIQKPFSIKGLAAKIREAIER